jgi:hypothetical protein
MDPAVTSSLITLATQIAALAIKYNDPNLVAVSQSEVIAHLEKFKTMNRLSEEVDSGFVDSIMEQVKKFACGK